jgi:hypothetical protein
MRSGWRHGQIYITGDPGYTIQAHVLPVRRKMTQEVSGEVL